MSSNYIGSSGNKRRPSRRFETQHNPITQTVSVVPVPSTPSRSPRWNPGTKLLIGLVLIGIVAFLLNRFANLITPLLLIFILAYVLHPLATNTMESLNISWRAAVNLLFLTIVILLIGLITLGGLGLVQQVQSLIGVVQDFIARLPQYVADLSNEVIRIGPIRLDMQTIDLDALSQQLLGYVQPLLGRTTNLVGALAGRAAETLGWTFFVLLVSYFILAESSGLKSDLFKLDIPGYADDLRTLSRKLSRIWNAFLRGQIIIFFLATIVYIVLLWLMGVHYALGLAIMAGLAKFLPYIGPSVTWIVMGLVTFFQPANPFGLSPAWYTTVVVGVSLIVDQIFDNFVSPRIMARTLKVHPAAVLITALIAANLLGLLGVVIAAPFLATVTLLGRYIMRKMFDLNPWPEAEAELPHSSGLEWLSHLRNFITSFTSRKREEIQIQQETPHER